MLTDAEIAGYMGWRGPGAYTEHKMRKVKAAIADAAARERESNNAEIARLRDRVERLRAALHHHIRIYRVDDEAFDPEAETDRLMALALHVPGGSGVE